MANRSIKTSAEIKLIAEGGKILGEILELTAQMAKSGVSTAQLNEFAESKIREAGGIPSFIGYGETHNPYPAGLCTSINDVIVHGIPSESDVLAEGDIIGLDIGMIYKDLFTDTAVTVGVGQVNASAKKLIEVTRKCLSLAIKQARPGNRIGDMSWAIQQHAETNGFSVVRELVGHGVGYEVHEDPAIPCYGKPGTGRLLEEGMVLAIEPMVCEGKPAITFDHDGWTIRTRDGKRSAHFEHTIVVTSYGSRILT